MNKLFLTYFPGMPGKGSPKHLHKKHETIEIQISIAFSYQSNNKQTFCYLVSRTGYFRVPNSVPTKGPGRYFND